MLPLLFATSSVKRKRSCPIFSLHSWVSSFACFRRGILAPKPGLSALSGWPSASPWAHGRPGASAATSSTSSCRRKNLEANRMLGSHDIAAFVPTKDSQKARSFYEGVLGLRFIKDDGFALVLDANGIMLRVSKAPEFKPAPFTILGWKVSGIEKVVAGLQEKGVQFERFSFFQQDKLGIWTAPTGDKVAWFKDPDGNILSVSEHV